MASSKKDYAWNTAGVFAQNAAYPFLVLITTRINGLTESGNFTFALALSYIFFTIGIWGGRTFQTSDVKLFFKQNHYVNARVLLALTMIILALVFCAMSGYSQYELELILMLVACRVVETVSDAMYGVMQINKKLYLSGRSLIYKAVLGLCVFGIVDFMTHNLILSSLGILIVNLTILFIYDLRVANRLAVINISPSGIINDLSILISVMRKTFWVFLVSLLLIMFINIPRYFIYIYKPEELGYFGIVIMSATALSLMSTLTLQPLIVELSKLYRAGKLNYMSLDVRRIVNINIYIGVGALIVIMSFGVKLLNLLFGVSFEGYGQAIIIATIGGIALALTGVYMTILSIMRRFKAQVWVVTTITILLTVFSFYLSSIYNLDIAVYLFSTASIIQLIVIYISYQNILSKEVTHKKAINT